MQEPSFNHTNHTHANSTSSLARYNNSTQHRPNNSHSPSVYDAKGSFGYGVGRLLREGFDYGYKAWQSWWYPPARREEKLALHRQNDIYQERLQKAYRQLNSAVEYVRKNPRAPNAVMMFESTVDQNEKYLSSPAPTKRLRSRQRNLYNELCTKIRKLNEKEGGI
jgi:hypothetical protein